MKPVIPFAALVLVLTACGSMHPRAVADAANKPAANASCPAAWRAGWQALANRIHAPVYCPSWMPDPLDARIGGAYGNGNSVSADRSYLVSFIWMEPGSGEVHVNFRGYPGRTRIPICSDLDTDKPVPCFSDPAGSRRAGGFTARVYTANQGADQWHVLYGWHSGGSLYAISEHVTPPYTYRRVIRNLNRMLTGLVLIRPRS